VLSEKCTHISDMQRDQAEMVSPEGGADAPARRAPDFGIAAHVRCEIILRPYVWLARRLVPSARKPTSSSNSREAYMSMATPSWWSFDLHRPLFPGNARGVEHAAFLALALVRPRPEAGPSPRP
jgi:hypothetical protein